MEYCGEVCTPAEFEERKKDYVVEKRRHYYFMSLKTDEVCLFGLMMVFCVTDGVCANVKGICAFSSHISDPGCHQERESLEVHQSQLRPQL